MTDTLNPRTRMLLEAPIAPTLLRLAAPNVLVMLAQAGVGLIETYFVGKLGTDARSRLAHITDTGRDKRAEAQRHWKAAQLALNETLGAERVMALHALMDESMDLLATLPAQEAGHDE